MLDSFVLTLTPGFNSAFRVTRVTKPKANSAENGTANTRAYPLKINIIKGIRLIIEVTRSNLLANRYPAREMSSPERYIKQAD